jgi:hypothetical protein
MGKEVALMAYYLTGFNSVDLQATCGLVTPGVTGVHSAPKAALQQTWLPGGSTAHVKVLRRGMRTITFKGLVAATTHAALVTAIDTLKRYLTPDDDFHALVVADKPGKQIMAIFTGNEIACDILPNERDWYEVTVPFLCYPYWEDITPTTAIIAPAFLGYKQATFEDSALGDCGWHVLDSGLPTSVTTDPYAGDYCMQVVTDGSHATDGAKTPEAGITGITAAHVYSVSLWAKGAAGGETVQLAIRFFNAASAFISEVTSNLTLTAEWAQYKFENQAAPALATKASLQLRDAHAATFFIDDVCFEEAAACGDFITPYDADTQIENTGDMTCYPEYTCELDDAMAAGLDFTIGTTKFEYDGALIATDSLVVDSDQQAPDVKLNGTRDFANTNVASAFPALAKGWNDVALSDSAKFHLHMSVRQRYW